MDSNQILLTEANFSKLKDKIKKGKAEVGNKIIIYSSEDDELNRKVIEKLPVDFLLINLKNRRDFQKQRNSGFNQVLAKAMKKKNIQLGVNLDEIIESDVKEKAEILGRLQQNIFLCNKNKIKLKFIAQKEKNNRDIYDLKALGLVLGMPTSMTKTL
jgi:RNase P/RNase MRP subunit p30